MHVWIIFNLIIDSCNVVALYIPHTLAILLLFVEHTAGYYTALEFERVIDGAEFRVLNKLLNCSRVFMHLEFAYYRLVHKIHPGPNDSLS